LAELQALLADDDGGAAFKLRRPAPGLSRATPDRAGNEPRIGRKIVVIANIDDGRAVRRADEAGELFRRNGIDRRHDASSVRVGRDTSACRLVGRSPSPWTSFYDTSRRICQSLALVRSHCDQPTALSDDVAATPYILSEPRIYSHARSLVVVVVGKHRLGG
jgi:hypothetical protein